MSKHRASALAISPFFDEAKRNYAAWHANEGEPAHGRLPLVFGCRTLLVDSDHHVGCLDDGNGGATLLQAQVLDSLVGN